MAASDEPNVEISGADGVLLVRLAGAWTTQWARQIQSRLDAAFKGRLIPAKVELDLSAVSALDTAGAFLLTRQRDVYAGNAEVDIVNASQSHAALLEHVTALGDNPPPPKSGVPWFLRPFHRLGEMTLDALRDVALIHGVLGRVVMAIIATVLRPTQFRLAAFINQLDLIVLRAVPIVMLISVVVGAIITQQSILQLNNFGVAIYVVDLAAILMLREVGLLLAAIMVAGRSGSAITAELGSMRMREELDALSVIGVDPYQALILPRILALLIGLPVLTFIGALSGLAGAAIVAELYGNIPFGIFLDRLQDALNLRTLLVGLIKAPIMAVIIGLVAFNEGFKVEGSAESLGKHTTAAVVRAIFLVIVADGLFAVFFAAIGV